MRTDGRLPAAAPRQFADDGAIVEEQSAIAPGQRRLPRPGMRESNGRALCASPPRGNPRAHRPGVACAGTAGTRADCAASVAFPQSADDLRALGPRLDVLHGSASIFRGCRQIVRWHARRSTSLASIAGNTGIGSTPASRTSRCWLKSRSYAFADAALQLARACKARKLVARVCNA